MNELPQDRVKDYLLAGKAFLTIKNSQPIIPSEDQFSFFVKRVRNTKWEIMCGHDFLGFIEQDQYLDNGYSKAPSRVQKKMKVFRWMWKRLATGKPFEPQFTFYHTGRCSKCSRKLTDAESLAVGIGPECRKELGLNP